MRRTPESPPQAGQASLETYKVGTQVAVNLEGDWKVGVLQRDMTINPDGKLAMTVAVDGIDHDFLYDVGKGPDVVAGLALTQEGITDGSEKYTITNLDGASSPVLSPEGHIEYTVKTPDGKVFNHVAQELLLSWKKVLELEKKVLEELDTRIATVRVDKRKELQEKRLELAKAVGKIYDNLPDVDKMQDADRTFIDEKKLLIDKLHREAVQEIEAFERTVAEFEVIAPGRKQRTAEERLASILVPYDKGAAYGADSDYIFVKESASDTGRREKKEKTKHGERVERMKEVKDEIDVALDEVREDVEKRKKLDLDARIQAYVITEQGKYIAADQAYATQLQQWSQQPGNRRGPKPQKPPMLNSPFNEVAVRQVARTEFLASATFLQPWEDELQKKIVEAYADILTRLKQSKSGPQKELFNEVEKRRKEMAKHALRNVNKSKTDYVDSKTHPHKSYKLKKSIEILDDVLDDWQGEYEPVQQDLNPEGKEIFDWDIERDALLQRVDTLKKQLEVDNNPPEQRGVRLAYEELNALEEKMQLECEKLLNVDTADKAQLFMSNGGRVPHGRYSKDQQGLNLLRIDYLRDHLDQVKTIEDEIEGIGEEERTKTEQKEIEDHQRVVDDVAEKHEFTREGIDIPDNELRDMLLLMNKTGNVRSAMELMMRGGIKEKEGKIEISQDLLNQIRGMFTDKPPHINDAKLRSFGIKNWDTFKTLWDTELAEKAAVILNTMLVQTLERKIAENTTAWDKAKTHKWSILGRTVANGAMIGVGSLGAGELVSMLSDSEDAQVALRNAGRLAGGAVAGLTKWGTFKAFFSKDSAKEKMASREESLHEQKREELIASVLGDMFEGNATGGYAPKRFDKHGGDFIDGNQFDGFTRLLSHTIRETSAGEESFTLENGHTFTLSGSDLMAYQRHLKSIETRNPDEKMKLQLAWAIEKMKSAGEEMGKSGEDGVSMWDNPSLTDRFMANMQGQETKVGAVATNVAIAGLMMTNPYARGAFGAAIMGRLGVGFGEQMFYNSERKEATQRVELLMASVVEKTQFLRTYKKTFNTNINSFPEKESLRKEVVALKRILHGTAPPEDMAAVLYKVKRKGKNTDGTPLGPEIRMDGMKFGEIQAMVYEAERENIYLEEEKQKASLEQKLAALQRVGDEISKQQEENKKWTRSLKKAGYKTLGGLAGVAGGVVIGLVTASLVRGIGDAVDYYGNALGFTDADGALYGGPGHVGIAPAEVATAHTVGAGLSGLRGMPTEVPDQFHGGGGKGMLATAESHAAPLDTDHGSGAGDASIHHDVVDLPPAPERMVHGVHETVEIGKGDNPWKIIKAELNEAYKDDPAYQNLTDSGKNYLVDGIKDQYTSNPNAYRGSFVQGGEFRMGKLIDDYGGLEKVTAKMASVDPSDVHNHELLRNLEHTKARIEAGIAHGKNLEANAGKFVDKINDAVSIEKTGKLSIDTTQLQDLSADGEIGKHFNVQNADGNTVFALRDLVGAESLGDHALLKFANGQTVEVYPEEIGAGGKSTGWKMHDLGDIPAPPKGNVDMKAVQAELDAAVANKASIPDKVVYGDVRVTEVQLEKPGVESAVAEVPPETAGGGVESATLADTYKSSLNTAVEDLNNDSQGKIVSNSLSNALSKSASAKMDAEFDRIGRGEVPASIQHGLDDPQVVKDYLIKQLSPEERLLFVHGEPVGLDGATYVDMAETPSTSVIRIYMPDGAQHLVLPPEGMVFGKGLDGELVLVTADDRVVPAEYHTSSDGVPYVVAKQTGA